MTDTQDKKSTRRTVREAYGQIAEGKAQSCCGPRSSCGPKSSCCGATAPDALAKALGYEESELGELPEGANMGLSCGNPTAMASLIPGEVVLDLGSGGGFDVFIAARKVGPSGQAIGVDMTAEMVAKARRNAATFREQTGLINVDFRLGEIEHLPVADNSVDVVISNCVINLSPDKPQVWREIARVLKPGGRVAVSDLALKQPLPDALKQSVEALVGCIAGAVLIEDTRRMAHEAGLVEVVVETRRIYSGDPADRADAVYAPIVELLPEGTSPSDFVVSMDLTARKTQPTQEERSHGLAARVRRDL